MTDDNYQSWSIKAHDLSGAEVASGNYAGTSHEDRVKVGDQFPGALNSSTVFTQGGVDISGEIFGGGLAELKEAIMWKHGLKLDAQGDFEEV